MIAFLKNFPYFLKHSSLVFKCCSKLNNGELRTVQGGVSELSFLLLGFSGAPPFKPKWPQPLICGGLSDSERGEAGTGDKVVLYKGSDRRGDISRDRNH